MMKRRSFLANAAASAALICSQVGGVACAQQTRMRRNVNSPGAAQDIETLRNGVKLLIDNADAEKYSSWMYWANSHDMPGPAPTHMQPVWKKCEHGTLHFLSWHRAYLYYFEELIRQVTGQNSFALPYWEWFASNAIPAAFTAQNSSLSHQPRNYSSRALLADALEENDFDSFASMLAGNPHGTVHIMVGGDMRAPQTAARDPVFWAHHCNVDRLWEVWRNKSPQNQNPDAESWLNRKFAFDLAGTKQIEARQLLDTRGLGYEYEPVSQPESGAIVPPRPARVIEVPPTAQESGAVDPGASRTLSRSPRIELAAEPLSLKFKVAAGDQAHLDAQPESSGSRPPDLSIRLKDIQMTERGTAVGFEYRLYVNLPASAIGAPHETFYVGSFTSFELNGHAHHGSGLLIPLRSAIRRQAERKLWSNAEVLLSIVGAQQTTEQLATIGSAELVLNAR